MRPICPNCKSAWIQKKAKIKGYECRRCSLKFAEPEQGKGLRGLCKRKAKDKEITNGSGIIAGRVYHREYTGW